MKHLVPALAVLFLSHCGTSAPPAPEKSPQRAPLIPSQDFGGAGGVASYDDIARFLAGRPVTRGVELSGFQRSSGDYHTHALDLDYLWRKRGARRTQLQAEYFQQDLRPLIGSPSTVVYPFGGPDILSVASMFPGASTYVLIGLEPAGHVPVVPGEKTIARLGALRAVMDKPLRYGYFLTKEMKDAPEVTTIMMTSLALMDAEVRDVHSISVGGKQGVEIRYQSPYGGGKTAIYISADLSNGGFGQIRPWLDGYRGATAYFKAASYLPHQSSFSGIRDWVLGNCGAVLQDDSGIPFKNYDPATWNIALLGNYKRPIALFSEHHQPDLLAAYRALGPQPWMPFGSGYHANRGDANLQVCRLR